MTVAYTQTNSLGGSTGPGAECDIWACVVDSRGRQAEQASNRYCSQLVGWLASRQEVGSFRILLRQWYRPGYSGTAEVSHAMLYVIEIQQATGYASQHNLCLSHTHTHTHTHPFNGPFPGLPRWAGTRKVKPIWILLKQETVSGSGISWAICKSAPRSRQITTPAPHHSVFYRLDALPAAQPTASKHWRHDVS